LGPSALSTVIIAILFLSMLGGIVGDMLWMKMDLKAYQRLAIAGGILIQCLALWVYYIYYEKCRPWFGWFCFVTGSVLASAVVLIVFFDPQALCECRETDAIPHPVPTDQQEDGPFS
jgi:hypothetical protein